MDLPEDWLEILKREYPRRAGGQGWGKARAGCLARIKEGHTWEKILRGTQGYGHHCTATGICNTGFVKQAATFYGPGLWFLDDYDPAVTNEIMLLAKIFRVKQGLGESDELFASRVTKLNDERLKRLR